MEACHLFFYFFESRNNPDEDDVIFWTNGGPGGSSSLGLLMELGGYHHDRRGSSLSNLGVDTRPVQRGELDKHRVQSIRLERQGEHILRRAACRGGLLIC